MTEHARMTTHLVWRHEGTSSALRALQWKSSWPIPCEHSKAGDPDSACITPEQRFCEKRGAKSCIQHSSLHGFSRAGHPLRWPLAFCRDPSWILQRWDVIDFAGWAGDGFCGRITKLYFSINLLYASLTVSFASCNTRSRSRCRSLHVALCARHKHCTT